MRPSPRNVLTTAVTIGIIIVAGGLLTIVVAGTTTMSTADAIDLAAIAAGAATVGAIGGAIAIRLARRRSIGVQGAIAALAAMVSVVIGVFAAAQTMFVNDEDLGALLVILTAAATVAAVTAVFVGRHLGRAGAALLESAREIGDGATELTPPGDLPHELARVHDELTTSAARLADARARERSLETSRRELVAWVSHDLRTPLAGIKALAEALEDGIVTDPEAVARYHTALRVESDRLSELVDDLFELSRTQAGVLRLEFENVSLGDLVSDALASAAPLAAAKGVLLEGHVAGRSPELPAAIREVLRALRNVLENAIRHTPSDGTVTVVAGTDDDRAYISVQDSGGGIDDDDLPRVFDVAFRGDDARTPGNGAGLGLAIARGIVEAHHGDISVRNENDGARFTLRLPLETLDVP
jgi:signal transduction histidine kinase